VASHTDSGAEVAPKEAGTETAVDREAEGVSQQDESNLMRAVEYLCLHRTRPCSLRHTAAPSPVAKGENLDFLEFHSGYCTVGAQT